MRVAIAGDGRQRSARHVVVQRQVEAEERVVDMGNGVVIHRAPGIRLRQRHVEHPGHGLAEGDVLADVGVVDGKVERQPIGRLESDLAAHRGTLQVVEIPVVENVGGEAVARLVADRQPALHPVRHWPGNVGVAFARTVIAHPGAHGALEFIRRRAGDDVDCAGHGVAPEQGALRAAQDFHLFDVQQGLVEGLRLPHVNPVHINPGARIEADIAPSAAHAAHRDGIHAELLVEGEIRRQLLHLGQRRGVAVFQVFPVDNRHGDRHVANRLGALLRRDHHLAQHGRIGLLLFAGVAAGCRLRQCWHNAGKRILAPEFEPEVRHEPPPSFDRNFR